MGGGWKEGGVEVPEQLSSMIIGRAFVRLVLRIILIFMPHHCFIHLRPKVYNGVFAGWHCLDCKNRQRIRRAARARRIGRFNKFLERWR
jgi:hypothetical protein